MEDKTIVEAALFAATDTLRVSDIVERTGLEDSSVRYALKDLRREYDDRDSAIMISEAGGGYRMVLRPECKKYTDLFTRPDLPKGVMHTLLVIAYHQPVMQTNLVKVRGPRIYEDVHTLVDMGFVNAKRSGQSKELTTTPKFSEQFGIGSTRKDDIRKWIDAQAQLQEQVSPDSQGPTPQA